MAREWSRSRHHLPQRADAVRYGDRPVYPRSFLFDRRAFALERDALWARGAGKCAGLVGERHRPV